MSISTALENARTKIDACYTAIRGKGGTLPTTQNLTNMATAISSIETTITPKDLDLSAIVTPSKAMNNAFEGFKEIKSVDLSGIVNATITNEFARTFANCSNLESVNFSNLETTGTRSCYGMFNSSGLKGSLIFPKLVTAGGEGQDTGCFNNCFAGTKITSVSFPELITANENAFAACFSGCTNLASASFPKLQSVTGYSVFSGTFFRAFEGCSSLTTISFPSLTTFNGNAALGVNGEPMFSGCNALTEIHFRADSQASVEAQWSYNTKFGATNATIYFDL